jgi:Flp pilus assembly pilin Flp
VLPILVRFHLALARLRGESGQTSAEYALVLLGAASVALLVAVWAKDTHKIGHLLDTIFDQITKLVQ